VPSPPPPDWYVRLTSALAIEDPATARAQARALLAEIGDQQARAAERAALLSSASFEGILVHVDGEVVDVNQRLCEMLGFERHEMLGPHALARCVAPEDVPVVR